MEKNDICLECQSKMKFCWCSLPVEEWSKDSRRRFRGYDLYCLECLEMDDHLNDKEIDEIEDEKQRKIVKEHYKNIKEEIEVASKFLSGIYIQFNCLLCDFPFYHEPKKEVEWHCEICEKYNYMIKCNYNKYHYYEYLYYDKDFNECFIKCKVASLNSRMQMNVKKLYKNKNKDK